MSAPPGSSDSMMMPKALTDFVFDLYDSVTLSQIPEEQAVLYETTFRDLSQKYFTSQPWPAPQQIASECNGDPLFLALYRELTHRHWHAVSRPSLRDRLEGWHVYCNLFDELLDDDNCANSFYLVPVWTFDILNEFVYQFQGYCQVRSAITAAARKQGLVDGGPSASTSATTTVNSNLLDNWTTLENSSDCWDVETVFMYLTRLGAAGFLASPTAKPPLPVYTYFSAFGAVATSRLECLLGDYTACLHALTPLAKHGSYVIPKDLESSSNTASGASATSSATTSTTSQQTVTQCLQSVFSARISISYHAATALLFLRRYQDAAGTLAAILQTMLQGFKTGQLLQTAGSEQFQKQYDRMLSLLAVLIHICPATALQVEESMQRAVREKHGAKLALAVSGNATNTSSGSGGGGNSSSSGLDNWLASPKFISVNPATAVHKFQVAKFCADVEQPLAQQGRTLRSYLKLYTSLSLPKLAKFYDLQTAEEFVPLLLSYKLRLRQVECKAGAASGGSGGSAGASSAAGAASRNATAGTASTAYWDDLTEDDDDNDKKDSVVHCKTALDIHYYVVKDMVHVDEAERPRRFENYFCRQLTADHEIRQEASNIDTVV